MSSCGQERQLANLFVGVERAREFEGAMASILWALAHGSHDGSPHERVGFERVTFDEQTRRGWGTRLGEAKCELGPNFWARAVG